MQTATRLMCDRSLGTDLLMSKTGVSIAGMSETHTPDLLRGISLESLRGFEVAARLLNYTRAAEELHVTQSAVSREIRALEDRIGTRLFERVKGVLRLSGPGITLYNELQPSLATIRGALERASSGGQGRTLVVSIHRPLGVEWLPQILPKFLNKYPDINVSVLLQSRTSITTDWRVVLEPEESDVDLSIRLLPKTVGDGKLYMLLPEYVFPCCIKSLANSRSRRIRKVADLAHHRLIEHDDGMPGLERLDANWKRWFQAASVPAVLPQQWVRMSEWAQIAALGRSGGGVFMGRTPLVSQYLKDGSLTCPLKEVILSTRAYYLVNRSNAEPSEDAVALSTWLIDEAKAEWEFEQQWLATKKVATLNPNQPALIDGSGLTGVRTEKGAIRHRSKA